MILIEFRDVILYVIPMASIHKLPNKPNWYCSITLSNGKRTFRSTELKASERTRAEAMSVCEKMQREINLLSPHKLASNEFLKVENRNEIIEAFITITQKTVQGKLTTTHAQTFLNQLLESANQSPLNQTTIEEYLNHWAKSKSVTRASGTAKRYQHTVDSFIAHLGKKAQMNLTSLIPKDFESFRDFQIEEGKSPATANMVIKTLRIPLNLARRQGLLLTNPAEAVDLMKKTSARRDVFTFQHLKDLIQIAPPEWQGMIILGSTTGCRIGDASRMKWSNIDFEKNIITYTQTKREGDSKALPVKTFLLPDLREFLLKYPVKKDSPNAFLFPTLAKKNVEGEHGLSLLFRALMTEAGIEFVAVRDNVKGKGRKFYNLGFHSLRGTYISQLAENNISSDVRSKLVGHSSLSVHMNYTHLKDSKILKEFEKFPSLFESKPMKIKKSQITKKHS